MSEPKWTPGPWLVDGSLVYALQDAELRRGWPDRENRFSLSIQGNGSRGAQDEEKRAVAQLIGAAPDLYEAALALRQHLALFCGPDDAIANAILEAADNALAKARGE